jgi:hypothetical protein
MNVLSLGGPVGYPQLLKGYSLTAVDCSVYVGKAAMSHKVAIEDANSANAQGAWQLLASRGELDE